MNKKKALIGALAASLTVFLYLLVRSIMAAVQSFKDVDNFTLLPFLWAMILLVLCVCHAGVYVLIMDKKPMQHVVTDDEEWWKKWDQV